MPIPVPIKNEKESDFVSRCIVELKKSDSDKPDKQIQAICYSTFDRYKKKKTISEKLSSFKDI